MLRTDSFRSLVLMPVLMGLGHLLPAVGAIRTATGEYQLPGALFGMIGVSAALVDSYDTYKDIPLSNRPPGVLWRLWIYILWAIVLFCTYHVGIQTAIQMYRFSLIGLLWGTPCIPVFSTASGLMISKPKTVLRESKSLVVAVCMAYVTADTSMFDFCQSRGVLCKEESIRSRSLWLAVLYQFFRETTCDIRDIEEDNRDGMRTLPVRLGIYKTIALMACLGSLFDAILTKGIVITWSGSHLYLSSLVGSVIRVFITLRFHAEILRYPKRSPIAWGLMSLLGLAPVLWAQSTLREV